MLKGYIAQLIRMTEADNAAAAEKTAAFVKPAASDYTPLSTQLQKLFSALPENQRNRDYSVAELIPRLSGQFRAYPSPAKVAAALKQMGYIQVRDYSRAGGGARVWRPK